MSVARQVGLDLGGGAHTDRDVDGAVEMALDARGNYDELSTSDRLIRDNNFCR